MKKILGLLLIGCGLYLYGMDRSSSSGASTISTAAQYYQIPIGIDEEDNPLVPEGKVENGILYLKKNDPDPLTTVSYKETVEEKKGLPFIVAVVKTHQIKKNQGAPDTEQTIYRVFEANELHRMLKNQDFKNRYPKRMQEVVEIQGKRWINTASSGGAVITDPFSKSPIFGPIHYFALLDPDNPFIGIGSDINYLKDPAADPVKKFMDLMFRASDGDAKALNHLGMIYDTEGSLAEKEFTQKNNPNPELAEYFFKKSIEIAPSKEALYNLGALYIKAKRGKDAEAYLNQAIGHGSSRAYYLLGFLYEEGFGGVQKDINRAKELYEEALKRQLPADIKENAQKRLNRLKR